MSPDATQTAISPPGEPMLRAMSAETMKIPEPIMDPATSITASSSDSPCFNPASAAAGGAARSNVSIVLIGNPVRGLGCIPAGRGRGGEKTRRVRGISAAVRLYFRTLALSHFRTSLNGPAGEIPPGRSGTRLARGRVHGHRRGGGRQRHGGGLHRAPHLHLH